MLRMFVATVATMTVLARPAYAQCAPSQADRAQEDKIAPVWGGAIGVNGSVSSGTQKQTAVTVLLAAAVETGRLPTRLHTHTRLRGDVGYGTSQKPGQPRITSAEMVYAEVRHAVDARQAIALLRGGSPAPRDPDGATHVWIYGVASGYHHIAFGLRFAQAYGGGVTYDVSAIPGLAVSADLRHISETFDGQPSFASWGVRVHETWSKTWILDQGQPSERFLTFTESVEIVPAFASAEALQSRGYAQVKLPITRQVFADITVGYDYLRNAAPGFQRRYWKSTFGIGYAFGSAR